MPPRAPANPPRAQGTRPTDTRNAIADASRRTGVDFDYLLAQARLESSLDPNAKARSSSASGLFQFIESTWTDTLGKHGNSLGLGDYTNRASRSQIMALRFDPHASALMAGALASDNSDRLTAVLGREPDAAELYMAHFLGAGGASKFLRQLQQNPDVSAAAILPAPAGANRTIFYTSGGAARSVAGVMDLMRGKMERAMAKDGGTMPPTMPFANDGINFAQFIQPGARRDAFAPTARAKPADLSMPSLPARNTSMADTLRSSFAVAGNAMSPRARDQVQSAYTKLRAFDL